MTDSTMKTSVYSEKLGGFVDVSAMSGVGFQYPDQASVNQEWSQGYWNRDLGDYWNRSW